MKRRLAIITEIISPYRIPLFNVLSRRPEVDLHVIFLAETDPGLRDWKVYKQEIAFSNEVLPSWRKRIAGYNFLLNSGVSKALTAANPDVVLCGGYNYLASWLAQRWARARSVPFFLWSESNLQDKRSSNFAKESLKDRFLRSCHGFVVPGKSAEQYLRTKGIEEKSIFTAVNAVDNEFFTSSADSVRQHAPQVRAEFHLPSRYFLFVGRLVEEKGIFELLNAYTALEDNIREKIGLVYVGDGPARQALERQAAKISPGVITFVGFQQREQLTNFYALSEMLILPTHSDTWGLVVNEGMACGLPVVLSKVAGCAADLVTHDWNGFLVGVKDAESLVSAMRNLATNSSLQELMSARSKERIAAYSPENWAEGIVRMLDAVETA